MIWRQSKKRKMTWESSNMGIIYGGDGCGLLDEAFAHWGGMRELDRGVTDLMIPKPELYMSILAHDIC